MAINITDRGVVRKAYGYRVVEGSKYSGGTVIETIGPSPAFSEIWTTVTISPFEISSEVFTTMINDLDKLTNREGPSEHSWFWSEEWQEHEREAERDKEEGNVEGPYDLEGLMDHLDELK